MKAPDEYGINKDFTEKSTDWIATAVKRCTDVTSFNYSIFGKGTNTTKHWTIHLVFVF